MKIDILAFGVHPDDVELSCAGTIAKHISLGKKVVIADLTRGELGTRGTAEIRDKEAEDAAKILGVSARENLNFKDGFFSNDEKHQLEIVKLIRKYQPEIILANAIDDRHPDHGRAAKLIDDACFISGLIKVETLLDGAKQNAWRPKAVYHYIQDRYIKPDFLVDISGFMKQKMDSYLAYKSQLYDKNSKEPATYISSQQFLDSITSRASEFGRIIGVEYAEGFCTHRLAGVKNLFDLI